ncbi:MBL fold metallo-hydrolase [Desulfitobacterium chlororespirans]|uniref:7,8-dihydropterin-6-yl-methyl-4-(Beta-D-ribofuranosyl)aminobenzene 5'-phosphate synthase n=1 Tax=Desulfitobacterium chlororespirans DSM 11544 TaxID=1121395 RepID=A0A1M7SGK6_9FIRM|nr:MBL fold metallo-hydrolase [Desulfitobacterium chlororespirans]SHN57609.1 7,8-dihydropterin-6-yl-methyl-4-(beta-D-ribofuranosyl)aminobenzene 5'-phosphate synthase [Desulfitobacterium chlororespirans DSM 11544]
MIIKTLVENTAIAEDFGSEHGLSLYIETKTHKLLFDVGASGLFWQNAAKLNVDIAEVDFLIISHGHYDHGGGLREFLRENTKAKVFLHPLAFEKHYALCSDNELAWIGLEDDLKENGQIVLTSDQFLITEGIWVFSNTIRSEPLPVFNKGLLREENGQTTEDTFAHEQNLVIEEESKTLLVTGCAHNGIANILEQFHKLKGHMPDYVIGGFHLSSPSSDDHESFVRLDKLSQYLMDTKASYYTCHCTGRKPYERLRARMGESINYLSAGSTLTI